MILVVGATGYLGGLICKELVQRGEPVRAMARSTSDTSYLKRLGVDMVYADLNDPASLPATVRGCKAVICTASAAAPIRKGETVAGDGRRAIAMIDAAQAAGVSKFVFISVAVPAGKLPALVRSKAEANRHLEASGLDYTILKCDQFMETWLGMLGSSIPVAEVEPGLRHTLERPSGFAHTFYNSLRHDIEEKGVANINGSGQTRVSYVATADVARIAVSCLDNPACRRASLAVGGPAITPVEAAGIFGKVLGREIRLKRTPIPLLRIIARVVGLFDRPARELITASAFMADKEAVIDTTRLFRTFPNLRLQTVEEFLRERVELLRQKTKVS